MASSFDPIASLSAPGFWPSPSSSVDPSWLLPRSAKALTKSLLRSLIKPETPSAFFFDPESTTPPSTLVAAAAATSSFDPEATAWKHPRTAGPSHKKCKSRSSNRSQIVSWGHSYVKEAQ